MATKKSAQGTEQPKTFEELMGTLKQPANTGELETLFEVACTAEAHVQAIQAELKELKDRHKAELEEFDVNHPNSAQQLLDRVKQLAVDYLIANGIKSADTRPGTIKLAQRHDFVAVDKLGLLKVAIEEDLEGLIKKELDWAATKACLVKREDGIYIQVDDGSGDMEYVGPLSTSLVQESETDVVTLKLRG